MLEELIAERRKKLERLRAAGKDPYPAKVKRTLSIGEALKKFDDLVSAGRTESLAGRVMGLRDQGGLIFADLRDESGEIQVVLKKENVDDFDLLQETLDRGDFLSATGTFFTTKRGEKSLEAKEAQFAAKSLRPLPTEWYGLEETEIRLRQRYLDLILNPETREMFRKKAIFWDNFRQFLKKKDFLEVETPALETLPGGADAEPFKTHHNALNTDFYLRISLELPLKKLLIGGYDAVFEIGRVFRNEGIDREHLQDYTQLEFYWAYRDRNDLMKLVEKLYKHVIQKTTGGLTTQWQGQEINWGSKWKKVDYSKAFKEANDGLNPLRAPLKKLIARAKELSLEPEENLGRGRLIDLIYKKTVRPNLIQPCFLINTPLEISPLAKRSAKNPKVVERVQVLACGSELGNGWSELNDPLDQRERFEEQMKLREAGDKEAQYLDEDFLEAMEYGLPPAAGFGLSERLFAVLMDKPVRETVFFPLMRPKE